MSTTSISKGNLAKIEIDKAMNHYGNAFNAIRTNNNNSKTNEIQRLINQNKDDLFEARKLIDSINTQINNKLAELRRKEELEKAGEPL